MLKAPFPLVIAAAIATAIPAVAQVPGAADPSRVAAGSYSVDTYHTQVIWTVNHLGISPLSGAFGASGGTLVIDPANPNAARVTVTFNLADMSTTSAAFTQHLSGADFFDIAKFPTASFTSTSIVASGDSAKVVGNLTIKGVTRPVTLDAKFYGAGTHPMTKKANIGFSATARIKRSDFGLGYAAPAVADDIDLTIHAAFTT